MSDKHRPESIEGILKQEGFEQKRTGSGARHMASKHGRGKGYMPSDLLKGDALKKYQGNSEVEIYHIDKEGRRID